MSIGSAFHALPKGVQTGIKLGGLAAGAGGLIAITAACASPKESKDVVREEFNKFDRDGQDGVGLHEAEIGYKNTTTSTYDNRFLGGDFVNRTFITRERTWTESALRGVGAADERGNGDAVASWQELTNLAMSYDVDGDQLLNGDERGKFNRDYGVQRLNDNTRIIDESTRLVYDPLPRYEQPSYNPPYYEPPTSGGDSGYGNGGYGSGGTSGGDSGYSGGSDYGNSNGDSGGYSPTPDYGSGDSGGSSNSGNSTDNGNAEW